MTDHEQDPGLCRRCGGDGSVFVPSQYGGQHVGCLACGGTGYQRTGEDE